MPDRTGGEEGQRDGVIDARTYAAMEEYLGLVRGALWEVQDIAPQHDYGFPREFIEHGELGEGLRSLAWLIHVRHVEVPHDLVLRILDLMDGPVDVDELPPGFERLGT